MSKTYAIIPAAGRGLRMGRSRPKQFLTLFGRPLLMITLEALSRESFLSGAFLVVPKDFMSEAERQIEAWSGRLPVTVLEGGAERQDSVYNALCRWPSDGEWIVVHDGVRPFVSRELPGKVWEAAQETGASIAALPATDTVKRVQNGHVVETLPRDQIWLVQTPQVFRYDLLAKAYREARRLGWSVTDDASLVERIGNPVSIVRGEPSNIKVTTPEDLAWAEWYLSRQKAPSTVHHDQEPPCV